MAASVTNEKPDGLGDGGETETGNTQTKVYDDENHLVSAAYTQISGTGSQLLAYNWGPNGHPIQIGSTPTGMVGSPSNMAYETLHWDGDQLLFTTGPSGALDEIKIGTIGDITPQDPTYKGLTFYDRDSSGIVGFCHNATGASGTGSADPYIRNTKFGSLPVSPCLSHGSFLAPTSIAWSGGEDSTLPPRFAVGNGPLCL